MKIVGNVILFLLLFLVGCGGSSPAGSDNVTGLQPPTNLAVGESNRQIVLSWTASSGAESYKVFVTTTSGSSYEQIGTTTETSYTIVWSISGITAYYAVKAVNSSEESNYSGEVSTTASNVRGPSIGEGGNQQDELFRSLVSAATDPDIIYVGSEGNGIFKSTDGGNTWIWLRNGLRYYNDPEITGSSFYPEIYEIVADPQDVNTVYAATIGSYGPATGNYTSAIGGVYKSTDGGEGWEQKNSGLTNGGLASIALDPQTASTVYIGSKGGTVTQTGLDITGQFFPGSIFKSADGAQGWSNLTLPELSTTSQFWDIVAVDANNIIALGINWEDAAQEVGIIKSTDAGETWVRIGPADHIYYIAVADADTIFAVAEDHTVYQTSDGGDSWGTVEILEPQPTGPLWRSSSGVLYYVSSTSSNARLYKFDGTVTEVLNVTRSDTPSDYISDIEFTSDPDIIYVGTMGLNIYKSTDGGDSYSLVANLRDYIDTHY